MRFLYLMQGAAKNVASYRDLGRAGRSTLLALTYDTPLDGLDFLPQSSFAQGRNHLYRKAAEVADRFDYFIFLDDDVEFTRGSFERMEENLERHGPAVGVPLTEKTRRSVIGFERRGHIHPLVRKQRFFLNDEQYLAVDREVLGDGRILPYLEDWDERSWFVCCLIQEALIQHHYHDRSWQFNDCEILNEQHSNAYPQNLDFAVETSREWLDRNLPPDRRRPADFPVLVSLDQSPPDLRYTPPRALLNLLRRARKRLVS